MELWHVNKWNGMECCSSLIFYALEEKNEGNGKVVYKSRKMLHKFLELVCMYALLAALAYCKYFVFVMFSLQIFRLQTLLIFQMVMFIVV
jgi:hypothetical protein